jgi:hypothetical protein
MDIGKKTRYGSVMLVQQRCTGLATRLMGKEVDVFAGGGGEGRQLEERSLSQKSGNKLANISIRKCEN